MSRRIIVAAAIACLLGALLVKHRANAMREGWPRKVEVPYTPSPGAAPYVTLGYREAAADLMWIRMLAYLGGKDDTSDSVRAMIETTLALDPTYRPAYDIGGLAIQNASIGVTIDSHLAAIDILRRGMALFPDNWKYPWLAGQIYIVDLVSATEDPVLQRRWNEAGVALIERAVRMPGAPSAQADLAAHLQETLGKHEVAVNNLREMILITTEDRARRPLLEKLAELEHTEVTTLASEMLDERRRFVAGWEATRPTLPATMYLLLGARRNPYLPPSALAMDRDLIGTNPPDELEPLYDDDNAASPAPAP